MHIKLAPLQGFTDYQFRNAINQIIGGIDKYYSPYLRFENDGSIKKNKWRDVLPENNANVDLVPQILVNNSKHFIQLSSQLGDLGYSEINWNLGCPYPMVAKRKLGSGLLAYPELIVQILDEALPKINQPLSIKLRLGYLDNKLYETIANILNSYPLKEVILHPRIGKQLYKGNADVNSYHSFEQICQHNMVYNGDIDTKASYNSLKAVIGENTPIMIGRGLIANPLLAQQIKGVSYTAEEAKHLFLIFHQQLITEYSHSLSGDAHILNKLKSYWTYFGLNFAEQRKLLKKLKKSTRLDSFVNISEEIINSWY